MAMNNYFRILSERRQKLQSLTTSRFEFKNKFE